MVHKALYEKHFFLVFSIDLNGSFVEGQLFEGELTPGHYNILRLNALVEAEHVNGVAVGVYHGRSEELSYFLHLEH